MATHTAKENLEKYLSRIADFEESVQSREDEQSRFGIWLHRSALYLRKLENYFAGTMLPQHTEQFYTICENDFALQARSEQMRAHDRYLEQRLRDIRQQFAYVARSLEPNPSELSRLIEQCLDTAAELRRHELEINKWFDQSLLRLHPSAS